MATNSSGITVSILAKVEGWLSELKRIQAEAEKINLGTSLGKDLSRYLSTLEKQINNMGKNLTLNFTSDAAIDRFGNKVEDIEERFLRIGQILSSLLLGDLNVDYVSALLQPLIDLVNLLLAQLNNELDVAWGDKIAGEATKVQKAFARIGQSEEDIKKLTVEGTRSALLEIVASAIKQVDEATKKMDELLLKIDKYKTTKLEWESSTFGLTTNIDSYVASIVSKDPTSYGFAPAINELALDKIKKQISDSVNEIKISKSKKDEIEKALNDLVPTNSVETIRKRIGTIKLLLDGISGRDAFHLDAASLDDYLNSIFNKVDPSIIDENLNRIKERFISDGISEEDLNKFWGSFSESIKNLDFDKAINVVSTNLSLLYEEYKSITDKIRDAQKEFANAQSELFRAAWTRSFGEDGLKELDALIAKYTEASETAKQLNKAQKELDLKTGDLVLLPSNTGKNIINESTLRYKELTSEILAYKAELAEVLAKELLIGKIQGVALRWFSIYAAVRLVENAIKSVISTVTELDKTITEIAIVTDMGQEELWKQMPLYTALALQYAASISGVYQVSLLYYQQGLDTVEVMELTELTLKMARISGLDYAQATDYMTNAIRSFKMEMSDALSIVDVYSAIAAASATDTTELASAMSKTASSALAVGSSFEDTTAMMAVMIEATRESAENIGSAMKSIISRYGEMTSDPSKLVDSEGEVMSLNRVDTALLTVGITIHDTEGKFRSFSDVIVELAEKWDTIDTNTQRYIATTMAGNRQQSRFLALVSSGDRLNELMTIADESEDASQLLYLKTLDSITAKTLQLLTSLLTLYTNTGVENWYESLLDTANNVLATFNKMPTVFGLPIAAIANFGILFYNIASVVTTVVSMIKNDLVTLALQIQGLITEKTREASEEQIEITRLKVQALELIEQEGAEHRANITAGKTVTGTTKTIFGKEVSSLTYSKLSLAARAAGTALSFVAAGMNEATTTARVTKGALEGVSGALNALGYWMSGNPFMAIVSGVMAAVNMIDTWIETSEERAERLSKAAEEANNKRIQANADYKDLLTEIDKLEELDKARHDSEEAAEAYFEASSKIAESMPELVSSYDTEGNAIIDLSNAYDKLSLARQKAAEAGATSAKAAVNNARNSELEAKKVYILALDAAVGLEFGLEDNDDISTLIKESSNKRDSENLIITSIAKIANTMRYNKNYDAVVGEDNLLDSFITALGTGNQEVLYNINSNEELSAQLINEINSINNDLGEAGELWKETINDLYNWIFGEEANKELKGSKIKLNLATATADASVYSAIVLHTNSRVQEQVLDARYGHRNLVDYLSKFSGAIDIINQKMISLAKEQEKPEEWIESAEAGEKYKEIEKSMLSWWDKLLPDELLIYNNLIKNKGDYTDSELWDSILQVPKEFKTSFFNYIKNNYTSKDFIQALTSHMEDNKDSMAKYFTNLTAVLGGTELKKSLNTLDQLDKLVSSELIGKTTAESIGETYTKALSESNNEILLAILNTDIFSISSIGLTITALSDATKFDPEETKPAIDALKAIMALIPININTETLTLLNNFTDGLDDLEKSLKNVSKGMDFKTMYTESLKLGKEISDFKFEDGKYYIQDYALLALDLIDLQLAGLDETRLKFDDEAARIKKELGEEPTSEELKEKLNLEDKAFDELLKEYLDYAENVEKPADFITWYYKQLLAKFEETAGKAEEYIKNYVASTALESGDITSFLKLVLDKQFEELGPTQQEALIAAVASGDISNIEEPALRAALEKYSGIIYDTFASARESVVNTLIEAIDADSITLIKVTANNKLFLQSLNSEWIDGIIEVGNYVTVSAENLVSNSTELYQTILNSYDTTAKKITALSNLHKNLFANNKFESLDKVLGEETFEYEDLLNYLVNVVGISLDQNWTEEALTAYMTNIGLAFNAAGKVVVTNYTTYAHALEQLLNKVISEGGTKEDINSLKRLIDETYSHLETARKSAAESILKNYLAFSGLDLEKMANALGEDYEKLKEEIATSNGDGTYKLNILAIINKLNIAGISEATANTLNELIAGISDDYLAAITGAVSYLTKGATNIADMEKFANLFYEATGEKLDVSLLFSYDTTVDAFTLNGDKAKLYIDVLRTLLEGIGWADDAINAYIEDLTTKIVQDAISIEGLLNALTGDERLRETDKLASTILDYLDLGNSISGLQLKVYEEAVKTVSEAASTAGLDFHETHDKLHLIWDKFSSLSTEQIINILYAGGEDAVKVLKQLKPEANADELQTAYGAAFNRLNTALSDAENIMINSMIDTGSKLYLILKKVNPDGINANGVITAAYDMVEVYAAIYAEMEKTAGSSVSDLNSAYVKLLTANSKKNTDVLETLENASGMTYEAFGQLMDSYGLNMRYVMANSDTFGEIIDDGFGKIVITNFEKFVLGMNSIANANWDMDDPRMAEAYSGYIDSLIEMKNLPMQMLLNNADQLKGLTEAKAGETVNVSLLAKALGKNANTVFSKYGKLLDNGMLQLYDTVDIPSLITDVANAAAKAGLLIPEALAELADAVEDMLSGITSLITGGIEGNLNNSDALKLLEWYKNLQLQAGVSVNNLKELDFTRTADGLRLATDSARELYSTINKIDGIQGKIVFDALKESLIEINDDFKAVLNTTSKITELERKITGAKMVLAGVTKNGGRSGQVALFDEMNGNVDLYNRNRIERPDIGEGVYSTIETATLDSRNFETDIPWVMNITPIPPDALTFEDMLSREDLDAYVLDLMDGLELESDVPIETKILAILDADKLENGGKGLIINLETAEEITDEIVENESNRAQILHEVAAVYEDIKAGEEFDTTKIDLYTEELNLAKQINAERSTTEDDSFKFMENSIPSGQNNPLNYWSNWGDAFDALKTAGSSSGKAKNTIGYQDFYNIVTEMGNLADLSDTAINFGGRFLNNSQEAADLITEGAAALKNVDGEMVVDLSKLDIKVDTSGLQNTADSLDAAIDDLADSQIAMLDSLIALLEVIVAMGDLKNLDIDEDMTIDLDEIFLFKTKGNPTSGITDFTEQYKIWRENILELIKGTAETNENFNADLKKALESITITIGGEGFNFADLIKWEVKDWQGQSLELWQSYSDILTVMYKAALSDNYDTDNIAASILLVLQESGLKNDLTIDVGNYTMKLTGGQVTLINWEDDGTKAAVDYVKDIVGKNIEDAKKQVLDAVAKYQNLDNTLTASDLTIALVLNKVLKIVDGETVFEYKGEQVSASSNADLYSKLMGAEFLKAQGIEVSNDTIDAGEGGTITTTTTIGELKNIKVEASQEGLKFTSKFTGKTYSSSDAMMHDEYNYLIDLLNEDFGGENSYEDFLWQVYKIKTTTETKVVDTNGNTLDMTKDNKYREAVKLQLTKSNEELAAAVKKDNKGGYEMDLGNGIKIKFKAEDIETEGEVDGAKVAGEIASQLGLDTALKDTISSAITEAFKSLSTLIDELDSKPLTEIADAISTIVTAIDELSKNKGIETLNEELGKLDTETLEKIGTAFETIAENLLTLATSGNWALLTLALSLVNTLLTSIDKYTSVFETIATSINTFPIDALNALKATLQEIAEALAQIDAKKQIQLDIQADGLDTILSKLLQIAAILSKITGKDFSLEGEGDGGEGDSGEGEGNVSTPAAASGKTTGGEADIETANIDGAQVTGKATGGEVDAQTVNINGASAEGEATGGVVKPELIDVSETPAETVTVDYEGEKTGEHVEEGTVEKPVIYDGETTGEHISEGAIEKPTTYNGTLTGSHVSAGSITVLVNYVGKKSGYTPAVEATGNVGKAKALGTFEGLAYAGGTPTLMGELGPELVVENGRYFVAGLNGAEMVSLSKDAIVFNHLQTESLLTKGMSKERGRAITNERNAVAFATGNINGGPAMASASAALAALKLLKAMWESLKSAKVSDLAGAGGGGGGGGGGSDEDSTIVDPRTWIDTVERWYNLTQEIAKLEKEITYLEQIRSKISSDWLKDGKAYYASLKKSLEAIEDLISAQEELNVSRQEYYNKRVAALKTTGFGKIYNFDENGQLKFNKNANLKINGKKYDDAMQWYTDLVGFDSDKGANYTNKEKYEILKANGFESYMKYDSNGQEIKADSDNDGEITDEEWEDFYENATKAWQDKIDDYASTTQSLWDEIQEGNKALEELETLRNELLKEMRDNQMEVENKVYDAIVEMREREIEALEDERSALEESVGKYIDGLSEALDNEREMYENQDAEDELNRNRRRLAILLRAGGSVSDINSLLADIRDQERELYFDAQLAQIDAIQEASDKEIERLDNQIELMNEQLEFQKEFGLLWNDVYSIMDKSAEFITSFILGNTEEYWSSSPLATAEKVNDTFFLADAWKSYAEDLNVIAEETRALLLERDYKVFDKAMKAEYGDDYDSTGKWKKKFKETYLNAETGGRSETLTRKLLLSGIADEAYVRTKKKLALEHGAKYIGSGEWSYESINDLQHWAYHYENKNGQWTYLNRKKEDHAWKDGVCKKCGHKLPTPAAADSSFVPPNGCGVSCSGYCKGQLWNDTSKSTPSSSKKGKEAPTGITSKSDTTSKGGSPLLTIIKEAGIGKASGGYVRHGLYELGERGTETVLTAQQTQVLRNNILSNRPSSLISLLKTYNEGFSRMETPLTGTTTEDNSTNIDKLEFSMNVQQISNDYDARRAGEQAMNEIMRIARKTSAANSIRR